MTELLINTKGANAYGVSDSLILADKEFRYISDEKIRITSFDLPLTLHYQFFDGFTLYTGPSFSYIFSSKYKEIEDTEILDKTTGITTNITEEKSLDTKESTQPYDIGWIAGVQYRYSKFAFSARYNVGLTKLNSMGNFNYYSHNIQLSLMINLWQRVN
jgi:long-subunit fatty acid transport protein